MKSVGKWCEFTQGHALLQPGDAVDFKRADFIGTHCYVYQQQTTSANPDAAPPDEQGACGFLGLVVKLPAQPAWPAPQCLVYRTESKLNSLLQDCTGSEPDLSLISDNNRTQHQFWCIRDSSKLEVIQHVLDQLPAFYPLQNWISHPKDVDSLSDVYSASALVPVLLLADDQLIPEPCHRLLADLAGMDDYEFLQRLQKCFNIRVASGPAEATPRSAREFGLYVAGYWYHLTLIEGTWFHADPVSDLDVSVVHDNMIAPMLGITDREDKRIAYTGADSSLPALQQLVDSGQWQAVWLMPAPSVADMMRISDLGRTLPAHSVCFTQLIDSAVLAALSSADTHA
jgi:uncharacterized protein (DUF1015 family)